MSPVWEQNKAKDTGRYGDKKFPVVFNMMCKEGGDVSTNEYQTATRHPAWMPYH